MDVLHGGNPKDRTNYVKDANSYPVALICVVIHSLEPAVAKAMQSSSESSDFIRARAS